MLGGLLVIVQAILLVCVITLLVLMLKNWNKKQTAARDLAYASEYKQGEPDYDEYEYDDNGDGNAYDDYYEEPTPEALSAARRIKAQQQDYAEDAGRYGTEKESARRYTAPEDETARRFTASSVAAAPVRAENPPSQAQRPIYVPQEPPPAYQDDASSRYNEAQAASYSAVSRPKAEQPPAAKPKPAPPEPKGVLYDDDDDNSPFSAKF